MARSCGGISPISCGLRYIMACCQLGSSHRLTIEQPSQGIMTLAVSSLRYYSLTGLYPSEGAAAP